MDTGSRKENASNLESRAPFQFHRNGAQEQPSIKDDHQRGPASQLAGWAYLRESASSAPWIKP
ncbi:hypothetical protein BSZ19_16310 [Bradyrhizobium japonicum]|uniref:Uncharacterized protein n=1 Tax=Bradyrhizobium japonicum TaxID=375 RepID=A0A1Y2JPT3_BRAJP|nr:hypothetical protein BSZ19_16310 [Bradyrhizobium japonicum]